MKPSQGFSKLFICLMLALLGLGGGLNPALAQEGGQFKPGTSIYTVQAGDTLVAIALRYNLSPADIALANRLANFDLIYPGQQLILPVVLAPLPFQPSPGGINPTHLVRSGETLFTIARTYGIPMQTIILANHIANPNVLQVGQALRISTGPLPRPEALPAPFISVELSEPTIIQGRTLVIRVMLSAGATLSGNFDGRPLLFNGGGAGQFWAITAIHALAEPKIYPLTLTANLADGSQILLPKEVNVVAGPYGMEDIQLDDQRDKLLDPELIRVEQEKLDNLWSQVSPYPRWQGAFRYPIGPETVHITSNFGTRRSYDGNSIFSFHGGADFAGAVGTPIYAPAAGTIVLAEKLAVRGNVVLIDHGLGLFSGYWHQNQLAVGVGQEVQAGDLIGFSGDTGLVTGPHLHWEMRLNGIAVEPLQWVQQQIP